MLALIGKNRAEGIGKWREARLFADWLASHLEVNTPEGVAAQLAIPEAEEEQERPALRFAA